LRISDQTTSVREKALSRKEKSKKNSSNNAVIEATHLKSFPLDIQHHARDLFYLYYVVDFSKTWDFLSPFFDTRLAPEYLTLSIDAVSLAFLSHQVYSPAALSLSRQKYVAALRKTNIALQSAQTAKQPATLDASLLLDLFEKITNPNLPLQEYNQSNQAHVNGALALIKLRGLHEFRDLDSLKPLLRLNVNMIITHVTKNEPVPPQIEVIRNHAAKYMDTSDPKWRISGHMIEITNLVSSMRNEPEREPGYWIGHCFTIDSALKDIADTMPPHWMYQRIAVSPAGENERILKDYYHVYPNRTLTQTWNVLRLSRILLCDEIISRSMRALTPQSHIFSQRAEATSHALIEEICATTPRMTDCGFAARDKLPPNVSSSNVNHSHTQSHYLDVYVLIFSLYVAAWSTCCPTSTRLWIMKELDWIAEHFGVKQAKVVVDALRDMNTKGRLGPWEVYQLLGSYAFAA
jgi:hypothetical protein